jgi:hypothetical protein
MFGEYEDGMAFEKRAVRIRTVSLESSAEPATSSWTFT